MELSTTEQLFPNSFTKSDVLEALAKSYPRILLRDSRKGRLAFCLKIMKEGLLKVKS